jgi:hypothetical protein
MSYRDPPIPEIHWQPEDDGIVREDEYRGQWPGGWKEDEHGHLMFDIRESGYHKGEEAPVWACVLCQKAQLHTLPEHEKIVGLAAKR